MASGILDDLNPFRGDDYKRKSSAAKGHDTKPIASEQAVPEQAIASRNTVAAQKTDELSVLGPTIRFKGELVANEDLMIQGQIEGSIEHEARHLTIGSKGKIKADIHGNSIIVQGEVDGDLYASETVVVEASARVRGNIYAPRVAIKDGARFKGSIDMDGSGLAGGKSTAPDSKMAEILA